MKVARTAVAMILGILLPLIVQLIDKRRLSAEARERAWNTATWGSALYAFGPLSMLGWSWVTRPRWRRIVMGPLWLGGIVAVMTAVDYGLELWGQGRVQATPSDVAVGGAIGAAAGAGLLVVLEGLTSLRAWWRRR